MEDHASALMVALIEEALRRQGLDPPSPTAVPQYGQKVALARKQALVRDVLARHGPAALLHIGLALDAFANNPVAGIFKRISDPHELIARCTRMDRYFHSRHRTVILERADRAMTFRHVALRGPAPSAAEDVVVAGMLAALVAWRGARGVGLVCDDGEAPWTAIVAGEVVAGQGAALPAVTARWRLSWTAVAPAPPAHVARVPARACNGRDLSGRWAQRVFDYVHRDPARRVSLAGCAAELALSRRTLQRRLAGEGVSFQEMVALTRLHVAADMLADSDTPVGLVGLLCGYADQPHFTREFRKGMDITPQAFRDLTA